MAASSAASAFRTGSTAGNQPRAAEGPDAVLSSIAKQEGIERGAPVWSVSHQQVEPQRCDIIRHRLQRGLLVLVKDLHIRAATVAGLGLHRPGAARDLLIGDALGRPALCAADAHIVPQRAAE